MGNRIEVKDLPRHECSAAGNITNIMFLFITPYKSQQRLGLSFTPFPNWILFMATESSTQNFVAGFLRRLVFLFSL